MPEITDLPTDLPTDAQRERWARLTPAERGVVFRSALFDGGELHDHVNAFLLYREIFKK